MPGLSGIPTYHTNKRDGYSVSRNRKGIIFAGILLLSIFFCRIRRHDLPYNSVHHADQPVIGSTFFQSNQFPDTCTLQVLVFSVDHHAPSIYLQYRSKISWFVFNIITIFEFKNRHIQPPSICWVNTSLCQRVSPPKSPLIFPLPLAKRVPERSVLPLVWFGIPVITHTFFPIAGNWSNSVE